MLGKKSAFMAGRWSGVACGLAIMLACMLSCTLSCAPALAKTVTVTQATPACTSWAGWHEWSLASLTPRGARLNKNCPLSIDKGQKVEVIDADAGEGAVTVRWRGKIWFVDDNRLGD